MTIAEIVTRLKEIIARGQVILVIDKNGDVSRDYGTLTDDEFTELRALSKETCNLLTEKYNEAEEQEKVNE
ncbi:hypothetical protein LCGC14_1769780 [marine sediment metagenome]|uniref:Roadblock/LAMTOR2 domain-containing protein n=1 Tax=marine sediment metagenome TaxID=412755 RepID=A0A0F9JYB3_9ZZZZ